jgi:hypothetical protein
MAQLGQKPIWGNDRAWREAAIYISHAQNERSWNAFDREPQIERKTVRMNQLLIRRFRVAQLNRLTPSWSSTNSGIARVISVSRASVSVRLSRISH